MCTDILQKCLSILKNKIKTEAYSAIDIFVSFIDIFTGKLTKLLLLKLSSVADLNIIINNILSEEQFEVMWSGGKNTGFGDKDRIAPLSFAII